MAATVRPIRPMRPRRAPPSRPASGRARTPSPRWCGARRPRSCPVRREPQRAMGCSGSMPMASRTWLGSADPVVQALPVDAAMPSRSRAATRSPPSTPSTRKLRAVRQSIGGVAGQRHARQGGEPGDQLVPQPRQARVLRLAGHKVVLRQLQRLGEADDPGHVLRARPAAGAPGNRPRAGSAAPCPAARTGRQRPSARRPCARPGSAGRPAGYQRRAAGSRPPAPRRHGTGPRRCAADRADLRDRLDGPHLVVGVHHADQRSCGRGWPLRRRPGRPGRIGPPAGTVTSKPNRSSTGARVHHRLVLDAAGHHPAPVRAGGPARRP